MKKPPEHPLSQYVARAEKISGKAGLQVFKEVFDLGRAFYTVAVLQELERKRKG